MPAVAAMTRSQVSQPTLVATEPDLPSFASQSDDDFSDKETAPVSALSHCQKRCAAAYEKDPAFQDESLSSRYTNRYGLWWAPGDNLAIPDADDLRLDLMREMHDSPYAGHLGVRKTRKAIEQLYTWPSMRADVEHYVTTCAGCQRNKSSNQAPALLQLLPVPTRKWGSVSMDLITALPETASSNTAIVVFVDRLSKMTHLAACKTSLDTQAFAKSLRQR